MRLVLITTDDIYKKRNVYRCYVCKTRILEIPRKKFYKLYLRRINVYSKGKNGIVLCEDCLIDLFNTIGNVLYVTKPAIAIKKDKKR